MLSEGTGVQQGPDSYFVDQGDKTDSPHALGEPPTPPDFGQRSERDPNTPPRGRERDADRERTQNLMSHLDHASPEERRAIRDEVVTLHLWLATSAARRYGPRSEYDDLVQVARGGLVEAFDRYDPAQTTYGYFAWVTMSGLLRRYLRDLDGSDADDVYEIVLREMEIPLFVEVLNHCEGNQSRAAAMLGIHRATLRKKLKDYGLA